MTACSEQSAICFLCGCTVSGNECRIAPQPRCVECERRRTLVPPIDKQDMQMNNEWPMEVK